MKEEIGVGIVRERKKPGAYRKLKRNLLFCILFRSFNERV